MMTFSRFSGFLLNGFVDFLVYGNNNLIILNVNKKRKVAADRCVAKKAMKTQELVNNSCDAFWRARAYLVILRLSIIGLTDSKSSSPRRATREASMSCFGWRRL
jgi:hypothetical protein